MTILGAVGATVNILGNSGASTSEVLKSFAPAGALAVNLTPAGQPVNLTLTATGGAFTHNAGASVVLSGTNVITTAGSVGVASASFATGSITAAANFQGGGTAGATANQAMIPWMLLNNGRRLQPAHLDGYRSQRLPAGLGCGRNHHGVR